jgi:hypothetical protein
LHKVHNMTAQELKDEINRRIDEVVAHSSTLSTEDIEQLDAAIPSVGELIEEVEEDDDEEAAGEESEK